MRPFEADEQKITRQLPDQLGSSVNFGEAANFHPLLRPKFATFKFSSLGFTGDCSVRRDDFWEFSARKEGDLDKSLYTANLMLCVCACVALMRE